jgi:ATP/ADP translocase
MLGIVIVLGAMSCLAGGSYKIGAIMSVPVQDPTKAEEYQQQYNVSLVVVAMAFMLALCGILMATTGWNPFANLGNMAASKGGGGGGLGLL